MGQLTDRFVQALAQLESERQPAAIVALFAQDAELSNPVVQRQAGVEHSAQTFWTQYRDAFDSVQSTFRNIVDGESASLLEWRSEGIIDGKPFAYDGVSVLETNGETITAFRAYFDPAALTIRETAGGGEGAARDAAAAGSDAADSSEDNPLVDAQRDAAQQRAAGGYS